jgi:hypothetical protein
MPRDAVAVTALASGAATATPAGVAVNTTNGATIGAIGDGSRVVVRVTNTHTATHIVTFKAGVNPPALRAGLGDLEVSLLKETDVLVVLETARFVQADGTINVDYATGLTGAISVLKIPKSV